MSKHFIRRMSTREPVGTEVRRLGKKKVLKTIRRPYMHQGRMVVDVEGHFCLPLTELVVLETRDEQVG